MLYSGPADGKMERGALTQEAAYALSQVNDIYQMHNCNITECFDEINTILEPLSEATYERVFEHLRIEILDVDKFVKVNDCKPVSDPRAFIRDNIPSPNGLLSNEIFGITKDDRAGIFAYIDLHGWFIDPSCYKAWSTMDVKMKNCVHGIETYSINNKGQLVPDPKGKTGIDFLRQNINKIKFETNASLRRDIKVRYLDANRDRIFINKMIVMPPYYRDKNTSAGSRVVGLGGINKLYNNLIIATNALTATRDYQFDASDAMRGRVQEIILSIYDWICGNNNEAIKNVEEGVGLSGKLGLIRRSNTSKTADFSSRLVLSACELKAETPEDMKVTFDKSAIPLSAAIADFRDFVLFHVKRFFEREFMGRTTYEVVRRDANATTEYLELDDPELYFSDERIKEEMEKFLHGYNNRFSPIEVPIKNNKKKVYMEFRGKPYASAKEGLANPESIIHRRLTWCDVFYMAAVEATKGRQILVTRFPIDNYTNQITTGIVVNSTKETEPIYINGEYYPYYPKIREEDINTNTSNIFVDTMQISNIYLAGMGADFDGVKHIA